MKITDIDSMLGESWDLIRENDEEGFYEYQRIKADIYIVVEGENCTCNFLGW